MRRYVITLLFLAFLIGSLFRAADQTGVKVMKMFGVMGIFLFGVVGTMALSRMQSRSGIKEVESALKALEPDFLITDWAFKGAGRPDYLVVGPSGLVAVCMDEMPQSAAKQGSARIAKARQKAQATVTWLRNRLSALGYDQGMPRGESAAELPVRAVVVLTRSRADSTFSADGVAVLNADGMASHVRLREDQHPLDRNAQVQLTRLLREAESGRVAT